MAAPELRPGIRIPGARGDGRSGHPGTRAWGGVIQHSSSSERTGRGMFGKGGPSLIELIHQALCSTQRGYDLLAPKFDATPFRTPDEILAPAAAAIGPVDAALDLCCGTGAAMLHLLPYCRERIAGIDF